MVNNKNTLFQSAIQDDEKLLWHGKPKGGIRLSSIEIFLIPITILVGAYVINWEYEMLTSNSPLILRILGVPFIILGLYLILGRFIVEAKIRKNIYYGITNKRLMILSGVFNKKTKSISLGNLPDPIINENRDGSGTIEFDTESDGKVMNVFEEQLIDGIEIDDNVKEVYSILIDAQKALKEQTV